jgi:hypothetical protein
MSHVPVSDTKARGVAGLSQDSHFACKAAPLYGHVPVSDTCTEVQRNTRK